MGNLKSTILVLPQESQAATPATLVDLAECSKHLVSTVFDAFDTAIRTAGTTILGRWRARLRVSGLWDDTHARIVDAPCSEDSLFGEKVNDTVNDMEEQCTTLQTLAKDGLERHSSTQKGNYSCKQHYSTRKYNTHQKWQPPLYKQHSYQALYHQKQHQRDRKQKKQAAPSSGKSTPSF